jgi:hexokinase
MLSWPVLNAVIKKKCEEHKVDANYFQGKNQLHAYFLYRRCEFLLSCLNKGFTFSQVEKRTKFSSSWLMKWYRKDKCIAKLNEEKELFKEDN